MLIQVNVNIVATVQNLILAQNCHLHRETWGKNLLFLDGKSSFVHINNNRNDILILCQGPTQGLDNTTLTAEAIYHINFTQPSERFELSLLYNGSNSFLFVHGTITYQFKTKNFEIKDFFFFYSLFNIDLQQFFHMCQQLYKLNLYANLYQRIFIKINYFSIYNVS